MSYPAESRFTVDGSTIPDPVFGLLIHRIAKAVVVWAETEDLPLLSAQENRRCPNRVFCFDECVLRKTEFSWHDKFSRYLADWLMNCRIGFLVRMPSLGEIRFVIRRAENESFEFYAKGEIFQKLLYAIHEIIRETNEDIALQFTREISPEVIRERAEPLLSRLDKFSYGELADLHGVRSKPFTKELVLSVLERVRNRGERFIDDEDLIRTVLDTLETETNLTDETYAEAESILEEALGFQPWFRLEGDRETETFSAAF